MYNFLRGPLHFAWQKHQKNIISLFAFLCHVNMKWIDFVLDGLDLDRIAHLKLIGMLFGSFCLFVGLGHCLLFPCMFVLPLSVLNLAAVENIDTKIFECANFLGKHFQNV